jgi:hypothetical protein
MSSWRTATGVTGQVEPDGTAGSFNGRASRVEASDVAPTLGDGETGVPAVYPHAASRAISTNALTRRLIIIKYNEARHLVPGTQPRRHLKSWSAVYRTEGTATEIFCPPQAGQA